MDTSAILAHRAHLADAAETGNSEALFSVGYDFHEARGVARNYKEAVRYFRRSAKKGNCGAIYMLGLCHMNGEGVARDIDQALAFYRKAVGEGDKVAQFALGVCYETGNGVAQDIEKAVEFYRLSALGGYDPAKNNLAVCLFEGRGIAQDRDQAFFWYRSSAQTGGAKCQYNLGEALYATYNVQEAVIWFQRAAEQGLNIAQHDLALCLFHGSGGIPKDAPRAVAWFTKAAEQNHAPAQHRLGSCYHFGDGVEVDNVKAECLLRKSADQGLDEAQLALFSLLYAGYDDVPPDVPAAACWLAAAAKQGNVNAIEALAGYAYRPEVAGACCAGCGSTANMQVCERCCVARFCCKECITRMWPVHKPHCIRWRKSKQ